MNKARRGELQCPLPVGFVYNVNNEPVLDPDKQVQESIRFFFETFRRTASACAVVKAFRQKGLLLPRRLKKGPNKGDLVYEGRAVEAADFQRWAKEGIAAPAHELGVLRGLFDEFGLDVPTGPPPGPGPKTPARAGVG